MHDRVSRLWHIAVWFTVISCYFSSVMKLMHVYEMLYNATGRVIRIHICIAGHNTTSRSFEETVATSISTLLCATFSSHLHFERQRIITFRTTTSIGTLNRPSILAKAGSCPKGEEDDTMSTASDSSRGYTAKIRHDAHSTTSWVHNRLIHLQLSRSPPTCLIRRRCPWGGGLELVRAMQDIYICKALDRLRVRYKDIPPLKRNLASQRALSNVPPCPLSSIALSPT